MIDLSQESPATIAAAAKIVAQGMNEFERHNFRSADVHLDALIGNVRKNLIRDGTPLGNLSNPDKVAFDIVTQALKILGGMPVTPEEIEWDNALKGKHGGNAEAEKLAREAAERVATSEAAIQEKTNRA